MNNFISDITQGVSNLVESVITATEKATDYIVIYSGRFQPFHKSHYETYKKLTAKFGKDKVFIGTSNKTDANSSPFSFNEKKRIMTKMFGISAKYIVQLKNPYRPDEITSKFNDKTTAYIAVVGEKDAARLTGKFFKVYKDGMQLNPMVDNGYVYIAPHITNVFALPGGKKDVTGTVVRNAIRTGTEDEQIAVLKMLYPKIDKSIFDLIIKGIAECITDDDIVHFLESVDIGELLKESTSSDSAGATQSVDDGPRYHYPSHTTYQRVTSRRAAKIGYTVLDYIIKGAGPQGEMAPDYPDGPVDAISYLPAGVAGLKTPMNQQDLIGSEGWSKWFDHVTRSASLVGYELVKTKEERLRQDKEHKQSAIQSKADNNKRFNTNTMPESTLVLIKAALNEYQAKSDILEIAYDISDEHRNIVEHLIDFTFEVLGITQYPNIRLTTEREDISTTAYYNIESHDIKIYTKNRALADVLRSIVHEIVHHQQNLEGRLVRNEDSKWAIGETDPWETEAHAMAGHIITKFKHISEKNIYLNEARTKQAVAGGKVQRFITGLNITLFGKKYNVVEFERLSIDNGQRLVRFRIDSPREIAGKEIYVSFQELRRGRFMATPIPNALEEFTKSGTVKSTESGNKTLHQLNENTNGNYDYSCLMVVHKHIPATALPVLDPADIYDEVGYGIEDDPHITVLYGIHQEISFEQVLAAIEPVGEINVKFTGISIFENEKYDVLKYDIESEALHTMNAKLRNSIPFTNSYDEYHPHSTIAYLKPGTGKKYIRLLDEPISTIVDTLYFSTPAGNKSFHQLNENPDTIHAGGSNTADIGSRDARAFGMFNGKVYIGQHQWEYHDDLALSYLGRKLITQAQYDKLPKNRYIWTYPGRLWINKKLISFWKYPKTKAEFLILLKKIEKAAKIKIIGSGWKVEVYPGSDEVNNLTNGAKLISTDTYRGSKDAAGINTDHAKSPIDKTKKTVPNNMGANKSIPGARKGETPAQTRYRLKLNENPDTIYDPDSRYQKLATAGSRGSHAFGVFKNKIYVSRQYEYHGDINGNYRDKPKYDNKIPMSRGDFKNPGRIWTVEKIISFYMYPDTLSELKKIVKGIETELNIKIAGAKWRLEINNEKPHSYEKSSSIIPIDNYKKKSKDADNKHIDHAVSPMNKKKKVVPSNMGSNKPIPGAKKGETPAQTRYRSKLNENILSSKNSLERRILLTCGGAAGHMTHPFHDMALTFGDLKVLIVNALQGKLETVSEKLDGQNIMVSWKNGKLIFARNKSHVKNFGTGALDINGIKSKFAGRGTVSDAFSLAADDLNAAIQKLSEKQRELVFGDGRFFMNLEIIFVKNLNTIPYDSNILIFHGTVEYNEAGEPIGNVENSGMMLADMIKKINQNVQQTFNISGPIVSKLPKSKDFSKSQPIYLNRLAKLQSKFRLKDTDMVAKYHQLWWEDFIDTTASKMKFSITNKEKMGLVSRWAFGNKSFRLNKSFISDEGAIGWAVKFDKNNQDEVQRANILPFELLFLELGAEVMSNYHSPLIIDKDKATVELKKELAAAAMELRKTKDVNKLKQFKRALEKIRSIGGMKAVVPTEGLVFSFRGKIYKLTGSFANTNTILGLLKY